MASEPFQQQPALPHARTAAPSWIRLAVQLGFAATCVLIGIQFHRFVAWLGNPAAGPMPERPPGAEGFLPISSLMSLTYWIKGGVLNRIHPAGLVIFSLTLVLALAVRRGFCSWACPVGTLAEYAHKLGARVCGRNFVLPRWLDIPLRSIKYILLGLFVYVVVRMSAEQLHFFIHGPYNRVADVKMYLFFANPSLTAVATLAVLLVLSMLVKNFWCRYLCPYGALLGLVSKASPVAVRREAEACIDCGLCARACPNRIDVRRLGRIGSAECTACFSCVTACRTPGALRMGVVRSRRPVSIVAYAAVTVGAFILSAQAARALGYWQTQTPPWLYAQLYRAVDGIDHPRTGTEPVDRLAVRGSPAVPAACPVAPPARPATGG